MVRSKTRNLLANIHMAVKVSRFSSPSHIHQFPCNVSSLTILISNDLLSTTLRLKAIVGPSHGSATHLGDVKVVNLWLWPIEFILVISPSTFCQRPKTRDIQIKISLALVQTTFICNTLTLSSISIVLSCDMYPSVSVSLPYLVTKSTAQAYLNKCT